MLNFSTCVPAAVPPSSGRSSKKIRPIQEQLFRWFLLLLFSALCSVPAGAQTQISGIINRYAGVVDIGTTDCCSKITIDLQPNPAFAAGDRVLIIQMKGAGYYATNSNTSGTVSTYNGAGNYEFATVSAVNGNAITLANRLQRSYDPAGRVQLVYVPRYTQPVTITGVVTAPQWNGTTGGIVVFEAPNQTVTMQSDIDVSALGFRGGAVSNNSETDCNPMSSDYIFANTSGSGAGGFKGEGIGGSTSAVNIPGHELGRGALTNGGGGGNNHNAGGGGGGNYSAGGTGGDVFADYITNPPTVCGLYPYGGVGGHMLMWAYTQNRIFLGGGGGGGHMGHFTEAISHYATPGTRGGGIVIIKAAAIAGGGRTIFADGQSQTTASLIDGAGGAGAGGTVCLEIGAVTSTLNVLARGGRGGDVENTTQATWRHGPGGGGGCGALLVSGVTVPNAIVWDIAGGANGVNIYNGSPSSFNHGANSGGPGCTPLPDLQLAEAGPCCTATPAVQITPIINIELPSEDCCYRLTVTTANCSITTMHLLTLPSMETRTIDVMGTTATTLFCIDPTYPGDQLVVVSFLNADGDTVCSTTANLFCRIDCCEHSTINIVSTSSNEEECCFTISGTLPPICTIADIRIVLPEPADPVVFPANGLSFSGEFCIAATDPGDQTIDVEYLDENGIVVCSKEYRVECGPNSCCSQIETQLTHVVSTTNSCCFTVSGTVPEDCGIVSARVRMGTWATVRYIGIGGTFTTGSVPICRDATSGVYEVIVEYRDYYGYVLCADTLLLDCNDPEECCEQFTVAAVEDWIVPNLDPNKCCGFISIEQSTGSTCLVYGLRMSGAVVGTIDNNGDPIQFPVMGGTYCIPKYTVGVVAVEFLDKDGNVFCTKHIQIDCPGDMCCDNLEATPVSVWNSAPGQCCYYIGLAKTMPINCSIYKVRVAGTNNILKRNNGMPLVFPNLGSGRVYLPDPVCIPAGTSGAVVLEFLDENDNVVCVKTVVLDCTEYCCEALHIETFSESCCGTMRVCIDPEIACDLHILQASSSVSGQYTFTPAGPNCWQFNYCIPGNYAFITIRIEVRDINGALLCFRELNVGCGSPEITFPRRGDIHEDRSGRSDRLSVVPNPANGVAAITYEVAEASNVRLDLYNARGEFVGVIDEGYRSGGMHTVNYSVDDLVPGTYFIRLTGNGDSIAIPLTVVR